MKQETIKNTLTEIELYHESCGHWPNVTALAYVMGVKKANMSPRLNKLVDMGLCEWVGEWKNGQEKVVKTK